jgi:dCTP diphosphatase
MRDMNKNRSLDIEKFCTFQRKFVQEREWDQFHTPKNLAMALSGEAGELVEIFQWLTAEESEDVMKDPKRALSVRHELADILFFVLRLADKLDIDLENSLWEKMEHNAKNYPVELSKGHATKYSDLKKS